MPWTALFFLVGAAAISGLPLLNGFVSEWILFQAFLFGFHLSSEALARFLFPMAGALAIALRVSRTAFNGRRRRHSCRQVRSTRR